jgi:hypothetical protein
MSNYYSPSQMAFIDQDNRQMAFNGLPMSLELESIRDTIATGTIGIQSLAADIDSLALGGGEFTQDLATAPGSSLLFAWKAGRFHNGLANVAVGAGSLTLAASSINYIQVNRAGVVSSNTTGFTSGQLPLWVVTTGASGWVASGVVSNKPHMTLIGANGVNGAMLSTAGQTKEQSANFGAVAATTSWLLVSPNVAATLIAALFAESVGVTASDTNYWTWSITNLGQAGAGSTPMLNAGAVNTTKATGGSALVANGNRSLALHGVPGTDGNLNTAANDVLQVTLTATGAPTALAQATLRLDYSFQA